VASTRHTSPAPGKDEGLLTAKPMSRLTELAIAIFAAAISPPPRSPGRIPRQMACSQARALVDRQGAAVITTGAHTSERFVSRLGGNCPWGQVPTACRCNRDGQCSPIDASRSSTRRSAWRLQRALLISAKYILEFNFI
jgi:hypothetical protein